MTSLPTLRRKILRAFSFIVLMYAGLGAFLVASVFFAGSTTPALIHRNYDSIAAANQMQEAWHALDQPDRFPNKSVSQWTAQFEKALRFEKSNITEPGEKALADEISEIWNQFKALSQHDLATFNRVNELLNQLTQINDKGMFQLAEENSRISNNALWAAIIYFLFTLVLAVFLADGLANRLSKPLKEIAEALQRRPSIGRRLKLIEPTSLEIFILSNELKRLWEQVVKAEKINVTEVLQQKVKLEAVLEAVEDGVLVVNETGLVSHCNFFLLKLLGLSKDQVQGCLWTDLPTSCDNYLKLRGTFRKDMENAQEVSLQVNGLRHQFSARYKNIIDVSGEAGSILFLLHDITEKKQRTQFRSDFIDLLSHEIKTPLQSLGTASEFLNSHKNDLPEFVVPFIEVVHEDVERIRAVANEFVQVTQSHSKVLKLKMDLAVLNQAIPDWLKPFHVVARDRSVKLSFQQEGSEAIAAKIDWVKFPWVISNLVSNAIRFSPENGNVEVLLTDRNGCVEIQVKDEGPGISEEDQRYIFEPFYQSAMATPSGKRGLFGVGLTIAREVVEAHEGKIEYFSRKLRGSEFRITLPFPT